MCKYITSELYQKNGTTNFIFPLFKKKKKIHVYGIG